MSFRSEAGVYGELQPPRQQRRQESLCSRTVPLQGGWFIFFYYECLRVGPYLSLVFSTAPHNKGCRQQTYTSRTNEYQPLRVPGTVLLPPGYLVEDQTIRLYF